MLYTEISKLKVVVYGTLKKGYHNGAYYLKDSTFLKDVIVEGFKLYDSGFPVAAPDEASSLTGELWEINPDDGTLDNLDRLEGYRGVGEHNMYERVKIVTTTGEEADMYVGTDRRWHFTQMRECPSENNLYTWNR